MSIDRTGFSNFEKANKEFTDYEKKAKDEKHNSSYDDDSTIQDMDYEDYYIENNKKIQEKF